MRRDWIALLLAMILTLMSAWMLWRRETLPPRYVYSFIYVPKDYEEMEGVRMLLYRELSLERYERFIIKDKKRLDQLSLLTELMDTTDVLVFKIE